MLEVRTWSGILALVAALVMGAPMRSGAAETPPEGLPEAEENGRQENSVGMRFVFVPAGEFLMGPDGGERDGDEGAVQRRVTITRGFYLGMYEVTQADYERVMGVNPSQFAAGGGYRDRVQGIDTSRFPVDSVSWSDAVEFCRRLSALAAEKQAGRKYRLPTEAEWEYACRAGTTTWWSHGDEVEALGAFAWHRRRGSDLRPHPVGEKKPNPLGLYDLHGNVWEWCSDWWGALSALPEAAADPAGPAEGDAKVLRGGGWYSLAGRCRSSSRVGDPPSVRDPDTGFRVVLER
jgi:formylglycine-generating enzyme required for sulfatase activity